MIPNEFEYFTPSTLEEAVSLLGQYGDEGKLLAGGHSIIPLMKLRLSQPRCLIDIGRLPGLSYIREEDGVIAIGALTTHYMLESSDLLKEKLPVLAETASVIADVQVRNRGTIGGSLSHADPAGDLPAAVLALEAELVATGPKGKRTIKAQDFFVAMLTTALAPDEILTEMRLPLLAVGTGSAYLKISNKASHYAIVGVAAVVTRTNARRTDRVRLGLTGVGSKPLRATAAEEVLIGDLPNDDNLAQAGEKAIQGIEPVGDIHASKEFRLHLAKVCTERALRLAIERAGLPPYIEPQPAEPPAEGA